jgi:hypothetical protein
LLFSCQSESRIEKIKGLHGICRVTGLKYKDITEIIIGASFGVHKYARINSEKSQNKFL